MPAMWNVKESHDVALQLQHKVSQTPLGQDSGAPCVMWEAACKGGHDTSVVSPDCNLNMQVEGFDEVERAFVHVDYERREEPEHKVTLLSSASAHGLLMMALYCSVSFSAPSHRGLQLCVMVCLRCAGGAQPSAEQGQPV